MAEKTPEKSQVELIIEELFEDLKKHKEFDNATITKLKELAISGNLTKPAQVEKAIKVTLGVNK